MGSDSRLEVRASGQTICQSSDRQPDRTPTETIDPRKTLVVAVTNRSPPSSILLQNIREPRQGWRPSRDPLTFSFVTEKLWELWKQGTRDVHRSDVMICRLDLAGNLECAERLRRHHSWSPQTDKCCETGFLGASLRDHGPVQHGRRISCEWSFCARYKDSKTGPSLETGSRRLGREPEIGKDECCVTFRLF